MRLAGVQLLGFAYDVAGSLAYVCVERAVNQVLDRDGGNGGEVPLPPSREQAY